MCETYNLPTASLRAPNHHPSFHSQSPRAPTADDKFALDRMRQNATKIDRNSCPPACARARQRRSVGFLSAWIAHVAADSTYPTTVIPTHHRHSRTHHRHSRTHHRHSHTHHRHSCTRARHSHTHPRHSHTHPRHSRNHPRHSREGGNPLPTSHRIRRIPWSPRPLTVMPIDRTPFA